MRLGSGGMRKIALTLTLLAVCILASCSSESGAKPLPFEFTRDHACSVCGMIIVDFPGSKAQMHYSSGRPDSFCSTLDMFLFYLQPDCPANITAIYVNDMGKADMDHPRGHWIDAKAAFYVFGAKVKGSMGESLVPFGNPADAQAYIGKHGGMIVRFDKVNLAMLRP